MLPRKIVVTLLTLLLVTGLVLAGCAKEAPPPSPTPTPTTAPAPTTSPTPTPTTAPSPEPAPFEWPTSLKMRTLGIGGSLHTVMSSWAPIMEHDTGMKVRVISEGNYVIGQRWLLADTVDTDVNSLTEARAQYLGLSQWAARDGGARTDTRIVWLGEIVPFGYGVWADSPIETVYDLKGVKFGLPTGLAGPKSVLEGTLAWANLTWDDIEVVPFAGHSAHTQGMLDGQCQVAQVLPASPLGFEAESSPQGLRYLEMDPAKDPEGAARFWEKLPVQTFTVNQVGVEVGQGVAMFAIPFFITTTEDKDIDFVYNLSKWFDEEFNLYQDKYVLNPTMSLDSFRGALDLNFLPVHEGTIKYLREKGKWDASDDAAQQANIATAKAYYDAFQAAIIAADEKGIKVDPENEDWIKFWEEYRDGQNLPLIKLGS